MKIKINKKIILIITLTLLILYPIIIYQIKDTKKINNLAETIYQNAELNKPLPPKEFKSDGCSLWLDSNWTECCVQHDLEYWQGGAKEKRKDIDILFKQCLQDKGYIILPNAMYFTVRLLGSSWMPTPFRWGFGWNYPKYKI